MQFYENDDASFTGSGANSFTGSGRPKGILRTSLAGGSVGGSVGGSGSAGGSVESHKSDRTAAKERAKDLQSKILDLQKQSEKLEPQIAHYSKLSQRTDVGVGDRDKAMQQIKRFREEQCVYSR